MNTKYLTLSFLLSLLLPLSSAILNSNHSKQIPALYVFGDSLVDSGNNNHFKGSFKANFLPYGMDFNDGKATGRFTNGKTQVDLLAEHLRLPLVPPYMGSSEHQWNKTRKGINYASAGSGILPETNNESSLIFDIQIKLFKTTVESDLPKLFHNQAKLKWHLSQSLFFVSIGVNDFYHKGTFNGTRKIALYLLEEFLIRLKRIYNLGARKFLVNNIPPAGCFPSRAVHTRPQGKCDDRMNRVIAFYNKRLPDVLSQLQSQLPGLVIVHSDLYRFLLEIRKTAHKHGIVETWKPCCPSSTRGDLICHPNTVPCADRNTHLFWDEHPTQFVNEIYARRCFNEATICRSLKQFQYS